jgi:hypothetical protein
MLVPTLPRPPSRANSRRLIARPLRQLDFSSLDDEYNSYTTLLRVAARLIEANTLPDQMINCATLKPCLVTLIANFTMSISYIRSDDGCIKQQPAYECVATETVLNIATSPLMPSDSSAQHTLLSYSASRCPSYIFFPGCIQSCIQRLTAIRVGGDCKQKRGWYSISEIMLWILVMVCLGLATDFIVFSFSPLETASHVPWKVGAPGLT